MPKHLERDLGLYATITVSIGAMIGSGLFVLPGLAAAKTGPSVILAYVLAGLIVLPAALSKAEMATAIPESGGTYLYIDRAMGPLMGTIAGLGAWFSLVFKSAFALVGLGAYLVLILPLPGIALKAVSLGLGVALIGVNTIGVKQSGRLQAGIVTLVVGALAVFGVDGLFQIEAGQFDSFFTHGTSGLLAATGFVFVSYAGVTKIASVAEEVENPDRNLPLGMLLSVGLMIPLYALITFVMVGVTASDTLHGSLTPMADAASVLFGPVGMMLISGLAVLALTSMANAGLLSSSRFPLAMSRDQLAPDLLSRIGERFRTPTYAIWITGGLLLGLVAFVPVLELAKLASAFKILIFTFTNVALIAFRESGLDEYDPPFTAPGYPWVQFAGIIGGIVLLTQMGALALFGAVGIIGVGILWYQVYGRERTGREGVALEAIRTALQNRALVQTEETFNLEGDVLLSLPPDASSEVEQFLLSIGGSIAKTWKGRVDIARFDTVPDQTSLASISEPRTEADDAFEERVAEWASAHGVEAEAHVIVCHDAERAVRHFVTSFDVRLQLGLVSPGHWRFKHLGGDIDAYMRHVPTEQAFLHPKHIPKTLDAITVLTQRGPYGPLKVVLADAIAKQHGASLRFVTSVPERASDEQREGVRSFHGTLERLCSAPTTSTVRAGTDVEETLRQMTTDADLTVLGTVPRSRLRTLLSTDLTYELARDVDSAVLMVRPQIPRGQVLLRSVIERIAF